MTMPNLLTFLLLVVVIALLAFLYPKTIHTTGAGNAAVDSRLPADKGCAGFVIQAQKYDGGQLVYKCVGIPYKKLKTIEDTRRGFIGEATMDQDNVITLNLYRTTDGTHTSAQFTYKPTDPEYEKVLQAAEGLSAGKRVQVRSFE